MRLRIVYVLVACDCGHGACCCGVQQVDVDVKAGVKDYMRKVVKDEILAKFTDWRRR